jgi:TorA maturation chaperone TorD
VEDSWPMFVFLGRLLLRELEPEDIPKVLEVVRALPERFRAPMEEDLLGEESYLRLRVDFTKTLLMYVHPYESVFRDPSGLLCTDVSREVVEFYRRAGYEPDLREARVRCGDHLALELLFVGELLKAGQRDEAKRFLEEHLLQWGPLAAVAIRETAATGFYRALGDLTLHFLLSYYEDLS